MHDGAPERRTDLNVRFGQGPLGKWVLVFLLTLALAIRIVWFLKAGSHAMGEADNVAVAIAQGRGFADAYAVGQGPTAHLQPVEPGIAGMVYRLLGLHSAVSEAVLGAWTIGLVAGSFLLFYRVFGRLGTPRWARLGAFAFLAIVPTYFWLEVVTFRAWEGGLTVFLVALFLDRLTALSLDRDLARSIWPLVVIAGIAAITFFTNPVMGLGCYAAAALFCFSRMSFGRAITIGVIAALVLALVLAPWTIRNATVMHATSPLRDNAGLEFAISMHPAAVDAADEMAVFMQRICSVHPSEYKQCTVIGMPSPTPFQAMQAAGGERAYAARLGRDAKAWMAEHPADVARLMLRHLRQTYIPPAWSFQAFANPAHGIWIRALLADLVGAAGLLGVALALFRRRPQWVLLALVLLLPGLAMSLFQPVNRYAYLFYAMLVFCAADFVAAAVALLLQRRDRTTPRRIKATAS